MLGELTDGANQAEVDNIEAAARLLRRMLQELQGLAIDDARLNHAMFTSGWAILQRLDMLSGIVELLKAGPALHRASDLTQRAKKLISQLSDDLDQLALEASHDFEWVA